MQAFAKAAAGILGLAGLITLVSACYTVHVTEQVIITQFGKVVGEPIKDPGLHFKLPFVQDVQRFDQRILEWDGKSTAMTTKDKVFLEVDTFGRWHIVDPLQFLIRMRDERSAQSRLDDIVGSTTRSKVADHNLIELIRTTKDRQVTITEVTGGSDAVASLEPITVGRRAIEQQILEEAAPKLKDFGIELLDVRFKRVNYGPEVLEKIYDRMKSEREQIAERFRSEGAGEAARIEGERERELKKIESEAYRTVQEIMGKAEAEATKVYAEAYNSSPEAVEFYTFQKTLETWQKTLGADTTVVLSTDSDLFRLLKTQAPAKPLVPYVAPAAPPAPVAPTPVAPTPVTPPLESGPQ